MAAVLLILAGAFVFYRVAPGFYTSGSTPGTAASSAASPAPTSVGTQSAPTTATKAPTSTATPGAANKAGSGPARAPIQLENPVASAKPFATLQIRGTYRGGADTLLQVQRREAGKGLPYPVTAATDKSGKFTAYVEPGPAGRYQLRVLDPQAGAASKTFVVVIKA